jgi:hypothetical protein
MGSSRDDKGKNLTHEFVQKELTVEDRPYFAVAAAISCARKSRCNTALHRELLSSL